MAHAENTKPKSFPIELIRGDITVGDLKQFPDKSFDIIVCLETIEHLQPEFVESLLKEIKRILAKQAFISTPNADGSMKDIPEDHIKEWGYIELQHLFFKASLIIKQEIGIFSNLAKAKKLCSQDDIMKTVYDKLSKEFDNNFLSLVMAKFMGNKAQNILRICE